MTSPGAEGPELGSLFDAHMRHEFVEHDVDATMTTMVAEPYVMHIATLIGGTGGAGVRRFYAEHFIGKMPADVAVTRLSRTVGNDQLVDEFIMSFTHDVELDFMLPGVPPTGRRVEIPMVAVIKFQGDKIVHEHLWWDQASVLAQVGLIDSARLPVVGVEQSRKLRALVGIPG